MVMNAGENLHTIRSYTERSKTVYNYEKCLDRQRESSRERSLFSKIDSEFVPWLTTLLIGAYITLGARQVCRGDITLGSFLATMNMYMGLGERFNGIYCDLRSLVVVCA